MIKNQAQIIGVSLIDYKDYTWRATSLLYDRIHQISNAKTPSQTSVLCLGGLKENPNEVWKEKIKWYFENNHLKDLNRTDGESMEFEWQLLPGFTTFGLLEQIQEFMKEQKCHPEQFKGRIIFMSMYNDIAWGEKGNTGRGEYNSQTVADYARRFPRGHWSFLGPGSEKKWYGTYSDNPDGVWEKSAADMMLEFGETIHPLFRASSAP